MQQNYIFLRSLICSAERYSHRAESSRLVSLFDAVFVAIGIRVQIGSCLRENIDIGKT